MKKLKRIGYLLLIVVVLIFIIQNDQHWQVKILFLGEYQMPAFAMLAMVTGLSFLVGFFTSVWLRKRKEAKLTA